MAIYSGFSHEKWPFSIAMLVHQRVCCNPFPRSIFTSPRCVASRKPTCGCMTCWAGNASARRLSWRARLGDGDGWWIIGSKVGSKDKPSSETMVVTVVTYSNTENIEEPCRFLGFRMLGWNPSLVDGYFLRIGAGGAAPDVQAFPNLSSNKSWREHLPVDLSTTG